MTQSATPTLPSVPAGQPAPIATQPDPLATSTPAQPAQQGPDWVLVGWTALALVGVVGAFWLGMHFAAGAVGHRGGRRKNPVRTGGKRARRAKHATSTEVQSLLFSRDAGWTLTKANAWAQKHGYKHRDADVTQHNVRLRQRDPGAFETLRTTTFGKGIKAIVGR